MVTNNPIDRTQTGVRIATPLLKVLKGLAEYKDMSLGDLIEGIDTQIAYLANTLSFLRVAAFSINHVALAFAVFVIAGMLDSVGHWVTVILGNVFILVLEGAIVAIQCLRLEYYEGFSRFFGGGGQPFRPLGFSLQTASTRS